MSHSIDLTEDVARRAAMLVAAGRDLTAREALACLDSEDPARQRALDEHIDALCEDMDRGKGIETTPDELMARVRARLGVPRS